jgi:hypothetical protein
MTPPVPSQVLPERRRIRRERCPVCGAWRVNVFGFCESCGAYRSPSPSLTESSRGLVIRFSEAFSPNGVARDDANTPRIAHKKDVRRRFQVPPNPEVPGFNESTPPRDRGKSVCDWPASLPYVTAGRLGPASIRPAAGVLLWPLARLSRAGRSRPSPHDQTRATRRAGAHN